MRRLGVLLLLGALISCRQPLEIPSSSGAEAALVEWKQTLYVLGGRDQGRASAAVWRVAVGSEGTLGEWQRDTDLPEPRSGAAATAFGGNLYLLGGESDAGPLESIVFALVKADGSLGYSSGWETNQIRLPAPVSRAALAVWDGRLILAGGSGPQGPLSSVFHARFWDDGRVGQWYQSAALPQPKDGLWASPSEGRLWLGDASRTWWAAPLAAGLPGDWSAADQPAPFPAGSVVARGRVWSVAALHGASPPSLASSPAPAWTAPPRVSPGSGFVKSGRKPVVAAPGTIRYESSAYSAEPATPTEASAVWNPAAPPAVTSSKSYAFRVFGTGGPSETAVVRYRIKTGGLFSLLQGTLVPGVTKEGWLVETYSGGATQTVASVTWRLEVATRTELTFELGDLSAQVEYTVFEDDGYTAARSTSGTELVALRAGEYPAVLGEGRYSIVVTRVGGAEGGSFSLGSRVP